MVEGHESATWKLKEIFEDSDMDADEDLYILRTGSFLLLLSPITFMMSLI